MIFNKWKKRAYEEREKNQILQTSINSLEREVDSLHNIIKVMPEDPTCRQIIELKLEAEMNNNEPTKLFLSPEKQRSLHAAVAKHITHDFYGEGSMTMIYGLQVHTTQLNMRVE
jgi:hypothetical protein